MATQRWPARSRADCHGRGLLEGEAHLRFAALVAAEEVPLTAILNWRTPEPGLREKQDGRAAPNPASAMWFASDRR